MIHMKESMPYRSFGKATVEEDTVKEDAESCQCTKSVACSIIRDKNVSDDSPPNQVGATGAGDIFYRKYQQQSIYWIY